MKEKSMKTYFTVAITLLIALASVQAQVQDTGLLENAAVGYWKAFSLMQEPSKSMTDIDELIDKGKNLEAKVLEWLRCNSSSVKEALKMSTLKRCRFVLPIDYPEGFEILLPHLGKARLLAKILVLDALRLAQKGQWEQTVDRYAAGLRMAEHIQQDPCLISFLIAKVIIETNQRALLASPILKDPRVPIAQLQRLQKTLAEVEAEINFKNCFAGEKLLFKPFQRNLSGPTPDYEWIVDKLMPFLMDDLTKEQKQEINNISNPFAETTSQKDREKVAKLFRVPVLSLKSKVEFGKYLQAGIEQYENYIDRLLAIVQVPFQNTIDKLDNLERDVATNANLAIRMVFPAVKKVAFQRNYEYMCAIRMSQILLAIVIYHRQHQQLPQTLDELKDIPRNPYNNSHFAYGIHKDYIELKAVGISGGKEIVVQLLHK